MFEDESIISKIGETKTTFTMEEFGVICKMNAYGTTYNDNNHDNFLNFDPSIRIESFLINPMRDKKLHINVKFMKSSCVVVHQLVTRLLLCRRENCDELLK